MDDVNPWEIQLGEEQLVTFVSAGLVRLRRLEPIFIGMFTVACQREGLVFDYVEDPAHLNDDVNAWGRQTASCSRKHLNDEEPGRFYATWMARISDEVTKFMKLPGVGPVKYANLRVFMTMDSTAEVSMQWRRTRDVGRIRR